MPSPFKFLVIEGCNGVGKSTLTEYLCERVNARSFHYPPEFVSFRRAVQLDESVKPVARLTYYLAATLHLSDLVRTQLIQSHVICDRYWASPLSLMISESAIEERKAYSFAAPFQSHLCRPDLTLLLTAEHAVARARISSRAVRSGQLTQVQQRMRTLKEFFKQREDASRRFTARIGPVEELDTTHLSIAEMCHNAWSLLVPRLGW